MVNQKLGSALERFFSYLLDSFIIFLVGFILTYVPFVKSYSVFRLIMVLFCSLYFIYFFGKGATPGMNILELKLIKEDGSKPGYLTGLLRYLGLLISIFVFLLGVLWIFKDKNNQGWHDRLARTYVVVN